MKSIRVRLLVSILGVYTVAFTLVGIIAYRETSHEIEEVFDAELAQIARMINQLALANIDSNGAEISIPETDRSRGHKYEKHISYQVWFHDVLVLRSHSAPTSAPLATASGYSDTEVDGNRWRVFALIMEDSPYRIFTAEDYKARNELTLEIVTESLGIYLLAMLILGVVFYFILSKGLSSLSVLSADVASRGVNQLKPLDREQVPVEVLPLVNALNELLARLDAAILKERRFTSDASHEIRTPLSSARLHAQLALQSNNEADRQHALQQVVKSIDKSSYLVEQMLELARLEPDHVRLSSESVDLKTLYDEVVRDLDDLVESHAATVNIQISNSCTHINSDRALLYELIRNLLDNAIRHNAPGTTVELVTSRSSGQIELVVQDNGRGIPDAELERVTERFYRISGQEVDGCGLGLAIAQEAAGQLGGELILGHREDQQNGLLARIVFPVNGR